MNNPRTPGAGISGADRISLGSGTVSFLSDARLSLNRYSPRSAAALDREADAALFQGRHRLAEYLADQALVLRGGA
jgi:hypothetical protein